MLFVSSFQDLLHRKPVIGEFEIDRLESATRCFDVRPNVCSVDVRLKVNEKGRTLPERYSLNRHVRCIFEYFGKYSSG